MKEVHKIWGKEIWIINEEQYCGKFLILNKNSAGSLHTHQKKTETFLVLEGMVRLELSDRVTVLTPASEPITIRPSQPHRFTGITDARILEISMHHDENDTYRLELSHK